ncbi:MAG: electron transfer flavoprotein subunit beta/FixA family protein [Candidatus Syntropharchaeia archaeon]
MRIIVCIKQVPDPEHFSEIKIDVDKKAIKREGIPSIVNPLDKNAIEEGLRIRERFGGEVIAISMGPPQAVDALREALAMGVDRAILLSDREFAGADTLATSYTLSLGIKKLGEFDLVICGNETVDGGTTHVPPQLSEFLGIPHVTYVREVQFSDEKVIMKRGIEHGYMLVEGKIPLLIAVTREINKPRYPTIVGIMEAAKKEIEVWGVEEIGAEKERIGLKGSPVQVSGVFEIELKRKREVLKGPPEEVVKKVVERLHEFGVI